MRSVCDRFERTNGILRKDMATSLFVLFREYADQSHAPSSPYIQCIDDSNVDILYAFCDEWFDVIRFFKYETCDRFYDLENVKGMLYPCLFMEKEYEASDAGYPSLVEYVFSEFKREGLVNWREEYDEQCGVPQVFTFDGMEVTNDALGEILRVKRRSPAVLLNCGALRCPHKIKILSNDKRSYFIDCVKDIPSLHKWFSKNRDPQRTFVYNPKHGDKYHSSEYISGTSRKAAQLETTIEDAQELLELAVSTHPNNAFWYYDEAVGKYIYFENQQEIRLAFHGYHLSIGDENYDNIDRTKIDKVRP